MPNLNSRGTKVISNLQKKFKRLSKWTTILRFSLEDIETRLGQKIPRLDISLDLLILGIAISVYTIVFSYFTILRHQLFQSSAWDLGIYMQSLYTTGFHGKLLYYTVEPTLNPGGSFLGVHFSPFLFLLVPLYRLAPFAETLLILQSFVIAIGAFGLYLLSKLLLGNRFISTSLAISYLLYTPLQTMNWFDFHQTAFIPIFFFLMFYFYVKKSYVKSFALFVLLLSTIEVMPILLFPFGVYCILSNSREKKALMYAASVLIVSIAWFMLGSFVKTGLNPAASSTFSAWQIWGNSYQQILTTIITRPVDVATYFLTVFPLEKALYFLWLVVPLFFLPLFARKEFILLAMPWIVMVFLSNYPGYFTNSYAVFVAPQIFVAAIYGIRQITKSSNGNPLNAPLVMRYGKWILWATIIAFILVGPFGLVPQTKGIYVHGLPQDSPHKEALMKALQLVPGNASVYTSFRIASHFANRLEVYANVAPEEPPDFIVIDLKSPDASIPLGIFGESAIYGVDLLLKKDNYSLILSDDGILIFKKAEFTNTEPENATMNFNWKDMTVDFGRVTTDITSENQHVLAHMQSDSPYGFWHGPYIALLPGKYEVTYVLKTDEVSEGHILTLDVTSDSGQNTLARKYVYSHDLAPHEWNNITLRFSVGNPQIFVEFRGTYASNSTNEYLDLIRLVRYSADANDTIGSFDSNYKDLALVRGATTVDDLLVHQNDNPQQFYLGLTARIPPGAYAIDVWLKIDARSQGHVFSLIANDVTNGTLMQIEISADDFTQKGSWQSFSGNFTTSSTTSLIEITGKADQLTYLSFSYLGFEIKYDGMLG